MHLRFGGSFSKLWNRLFPVFGRMIFGGWFWRNRRWYCLRIFVLDHTMENLWWKISGDALIFFSVNGQSSNSMRSDSPASATYWKVRSIANWHHPKHVGKIAERFCQLRLSNPDFPPTHVFPYATWSALFLRWRSLGTSRN